MLRLRHLLPRMRLFSSAAAKHFEIVELKDAD